MARITGNGGVPLQTKLTFTERRREVARLYLEGWQQVDLAEKYGVNQSTISRDLEAIRQEWLQSAVIDFNEIKAQELVRIDHLEREYWTAWERSQEDAETVRQEAVEGGKKKAIKIAKGQAGDPRFLQGIQWCIEQRLRIFGIYEAVKVDLTSKGEKVGAITYITENRPQDD